MAELKIEQDALRDTVTINGIVYARSVFEDFGATMPLGRVFRLVSRENNVLTIEYLPAGVTGTPAPEGWNEEQRAALKRIEEDPQGALEEFLGVPRSAGVGVVATTERVEVGRLVLPAFDGDEYGEPEIDAFMGRIEAVQQRVQKTRARTELAVFVEVPADGVAASHVCPNVKGNAHEGYYCNVCEGGPCTRGVAPSHGIDPENQYIGDLMILQVLADSKAVNDQEREVLLRWIEQSQSPGVRVVDPFEQAMRETWQMVDPFNPPPPGSYARGSHEGICAALKTLRENYERLRAAVHKSEPFTKVSDADVDAEIRRSGCLRTDENRAVVRARLETARGVKEADRG